MNTQCFRLIFNKARGCLMAVAETATDRRKGNGRSLPSTGGVFQNQPITEATLRPATYALLCILGGIVFLSGALAQAQIVANRAAPANQQATVLSAANGVPVINIQTPSSAGVSHNTYTQFDVTHRGAILNNARNNAPTQLGGWVQGNPWLAGGTARIILNEVNASNPSLLQGYIEVAGDRAQVVIANPAGIACDGCGFINANHTTLTTGTPTFTNGNLDGYRVQGGAITIDGAGLDASRSDYTDLIARTMQINAGIWAQNLKLVTGANHVSTDTQQIAPTVVNGHAPGFAIDVAQLGGMYAGKITLIGTEAGIGVSNAGQIGASVGEVSLTIDGHLNNLGQIISRDNAQLTAALGVSNSGTLSSEGALRIDTIGDIANHGIISAQRHTTLMASGATSRISGTATSILGASVQNDGSLGATGDLSVTATHEIALHGQNLTGGNQNLNAQTLDLSGSTTIGRNLNLRTGRGDAELNHATLLADGSLNLFTAGTAHADAAQIAAGQLNLVAHDISNRQGSLQQTGGGTLNITLPGTLDNTQGRIIANSQNLGLTATNLLNSNGRIEHAGIGTLALTADTLESTQGTIASNGLLVLNATTTTFDGGVARARQLSLTSPVLSNRGGQLLQSGPMGTPGAALIATTLLDNTSGLIASTNDLTLTLGNLNNHGGTIQTQGTGTATLTLAASGLVDNGQLGTTSGLIGSTGALRLDAASLNNTDSQLSAGTTADATIVGTITNRGGTLVAAQQINLVAASIDNHLGTIGSVHAGAQISTNGGSLNNQQGRIEAAATLHIDAHGVNNGGGIILANNLTLDSHGQNFDNTHGDLTAISALNINSGTFDNTRGLAQAQTTLNIDTHGQNLTNTNTRSTGGLLSQGTLTLTSGSLDNRDGSITSHRNLSANTTTLTNALAGYIGSESNLTLNTTILDNQGGQLQANYDIALTASSGTLDNRGGLIAAGHTLAVVADTLDNTATHPPTQGIEAAFIRIQAKNLDNALGRLAADDTATLILSHTLNNTQGSIASLKTIDLRDPLAIGIPGNPTGKTLTITNTQGTLIAGQTLAVNAASLTGDGKLVSLGDINVRLLGHYTQTGQLQADGNVGLETAGTLVNQSTLQAGNTLTLTAATLDNQVSGQLLGAHLDLTATASHTFTNRGLINGSDTFINTITLNNLGTGRIYGDHVALGATTLNNVAESGIAPVIAARNRLDLGITDLTNSEHALIYSAGDLAIGGTLNTHHHAAGQGNSLINTSATLEAGGNMDLAIAGLTNHNAHFTTAQVVISTHSIDEHIGEGAVTRYPHSDAYPQHVRDSFYRWIIHGGMYDRSYEYIYTRTITETQVTASDPGQILAGGNLNLTANNILNDNSRIIAGGALTGNVGVLNNTTYSGQQITTDLGTVLHYVDHQPGGCCNDWTEIQYTAYAPAASIQTLTLGPTVYAGNTAPGGSGTSINNLNLANLVQGPIGSNTSPVFVGANRALTPITQVAALNTNTSPPVAPIIRTGGFATTVPNNAFFHTPVASAYYLVETDPAFANYRTWLSSDYLLQALSLDPAALQKRLGDGFYEQRLVNEQLLQLTGQRFLAGYADDEAQYRALMNAGVTYARAHGLTPGVALSAAQMAQLTSDIVWLVDQPVTLADGTTTHALVPQLYVRTQPGDLAPSGSLIAADRVDLHLDQTLLNQGRIAGRTLVRLNADTLNNLGGQIQGQTVALSALTDLINRGGQIRAEEALVLSAGRDLTVASTIRDTQSAQGTRTGIDRLAGLYVSNPDALLVASAGRDLTLTAATLENRGTASQTQLSAGRDLNLATVTEAQTQNNRWSSTNYRHQGQQQQVGSALTTGSDLTLWAGRDLTARAAQLASQTGTLTLNAAQDVTLSAGQAALHLDEAHQHTDRGFFSRSTVRTRDTLDQTQAVGSSLSGATVSISAGQDVRLQGSAVVSDTDTRVRAWRDVVLASATETLQESHAYAKQTSGLFSGGGLSLTLGTQKLRTDAKDQGATALASTVGSLQGNVELAAGQHYTQTGSDVLAPAGDITVRAQNIRIDEARETRRSETRTEFEQSGLTLALSSPITTAIQTTQQMQTAARKTSDPRMKALAAASAGLNVYNNAEAIGKQGAALAQGDVSSGVSLSLSVGSSQNQSSTTQTRDTAAVSRVTAGRDVTLVAASTSVRPPITSGAGAKPVEGQGDLTLQGAQVRAGRNATLAADHDIQLQAAENTASLNSKNSGASASVGVSFGSQTGFTVSASGSQGKAKGNDTTYSNTQVEAGQQATLTSGNDTTLKGGVVKAPQVVAKAGRDLTVESLQDRSTYRSKQDSVGGSVTIGPAPGGSLSLAASKIDSDFQSVTEQSGLKAGDQGFQVAVGGNTTLTGGAITSTQTAIDQNKNTFHTGGTLALADIQNTSEYTGESAGVTLGTRVSLNGKLAPLGSSAGLGSDGSSANSVTRAGISGIAGNTAARTGDAETGLAKTFDAGKVQGEIDAQVAITQTFNALAPKAAVKYANTKAMALKKLAESETDPDTRAGLLIEAKKWSPNGSYTIAMNIIIGVAGGTATSAITKETLSWAANEMRRSMIEDSKKFKGICDTQGNCISNISGESVGINGDGVKVAGGRLILQNWCAEGRCETDKTTVSGYKENPNGTVRFNPGLNTDGSQMTLAQFIENHQEWRSPLGGHQGGEGQMELAGIQFNYSKGSFWDKLAEAYAGTHDTLNSAIWYDKLGNGKNLDGTIIGQFGNATNTTNVLLATPFALSLLLPPEVWHTISIAVEIK